MTHEELAATLGVSRRAVGAWHEKPDMVISTELQRALDTVYERATDPAKIRFARQLSADDADAAAAAKAGGAVALAVAISVVVADGDVLIVCRRDTDASGITWQFPAGVVKPGASPEIVAVRETLAETGIHCAIRAKLGSRLHPLSSVYCDYFLCEYLAGTVENRDVSENVSAIWIRLRDLTRFIPADMIYPPVLRALEELNDPAA